MAHSLGSTTLLPPKNNFIVKMSYIVRDVKIFFEKNKTKTVGNFYSKSFIEYESNDDNDDSFIEEIKYFILKYFLP